MCNIYSSWISLNLINGFTGLFSLGHAGFIAVGAYTTAILTMSEKVKTQKFLYGTFNGTI